MQQPEVATRVLGKEKSTRLQHKWTKEQKDRLWRLSKEDKSLKNIQLKFNLECGLTLTMDSINRQLANIKKINKIPLRPRHVWTKPKKDLLQTLLDKKESYKNIQLALEREFGMTCSIAAIRRLHDKIKNPIGISFSAIFTWQVLY